MSSRVAPSFAPASKRPAAGKLTVFARIRSGRGASGWVRNTRDAPGADRSRPHAVL
jgi:hypothetical protein